MLRDLSKETWDIIIQAGQSNAEGSGFGPASEPWYPDDLVYYLEPDMALVRATERVCGNRIQSNFALAFARDYIRGGLLAEGRKLLILRSAVGGTGFLDGRWHMEGDLYLHMLEMIRTALEMNSGNRLVALLWHQGETDAILGATYEQHHRHLKDLLTSVRDTFGVPELPFVAGDFVQHWEQDNLAICESVVRAMRCLCEELPRCGFVETDGLASNTQEKANEGLDPVECIHFSREALYQLGHRYFGMFLRLIR